MKRTLKPFKGFDTVEFGMSKKKIQDITNVKESKVTNAVLKESKIYDGPITYAFYGDKLVYIEMEYQEGIYFNDVDVFSVNDVNDFLRGFKIESKKDNTLVKELGLILMDFKKKDVTKRSLIFYSKEAAPDFDFFLDVV